MTDFNWTATFGEVKTAAQWTDLGDNDRFLYTYTGEGTNAIQQCVQTVYSSASTGTTIIPADNTIPQNTEGTEFMSQAITPKSATNLLVIQANIFVGYSVAAYMVAALFQDSTANALAVGGANITASNHIYNIPVYHKMTAGTTSSTTFKIRAGGHTAGTTTFNGNAGASLYGAITKSFIQVTEYKV